MRPPGELTEDFGMSDGRQPDPMLDEELTRLIQQGRDREAAVLASDRLAAPTRGAFMDPRTQLDEILPMLNQLTGSLSDAQLDAPTACSKFAVRDILEHMIGGATMFAGAFRGAAPVDRTGETDLVAVFPTAMADLRQGVNSPGALERTIASPLGEVPGEVFARFVALDGLVHGWDIATATGQPYEPPAAVVAEVDAFARQAISEAMRDGDTFAAPVDAPAGASPLVQLVAFTGRQV
ncbi:MAG: hypothetical protein QOJ23_4466 [Actinomycetota bacterium]|jgi:uncharacterized protein (TIGR03086 family)|nr:hypothetical protein [Actinomycetota bacterium]